MNPIGMEATGKLASGVGAGLGLGLGFGLSPLVFFLFFLPFFSSDSESPLTEAASFAFLKAGCSPPSNYICVLRVLTVLFTRSYMFLKYSLASLVASGQKHQREMPEYLH